MKTPCCNYEPHTLKLRESMSSSEFLERVSELEQECIRLEKIMVDHQFVASHKMDDAICGLHKVRSCWNHSIWGGAASCAPATPTHSAETSPDPAA